MRKAAKGALVTVGVLAVLGSIWYAKGKKKPVPVPVPAVANVVGYSELG